MMARLRRSPFPEIGLFSVASLLFFAYRYLDEVASAEAIDPLEPLIEEFTGVMNAGLLFFAVRRLARWAPIAGDRWPSRVSLHGAALIVFSLVHTSMNWASREVLFPLAGLGDYDYGVMRVRYLMEFPIDVIIYSCFVAGVWSADRWRAERRRDLEAAALQSRLAEARLQNLQLQLQPHFLFNALNTISSVMYQDPGAADVMLARLAELLRYALRTTDAHEVPLSTELDALDHYLALVGARFGEDFSHTTEIDPAAREAAVPALVLQPLVENAVRHGGLAWVGRGRVIVRARRDGDQLSVEVENDGPGVAGERAATGSLASKTMASREGMGLAATAERLQLLYGSGHRFEAGNIEGGFRVRIEIPWRDVGRLDAGAEAPALRTADADAGADQPPPRLRRSAEASAKAEAPALRTADADAGAEAPALRAAGETVRSAGTSVPAHGAALKGRP
jgi:signal transduction histidine kinase